MNLRQQITKISGSEPPKDPNNLRQCMKDFYDFKEKKTDRGVSYLGSLIRENRINQNDLRNFEMHKEQLEKVNSLILQNREKAAFDLFFKSFPTCLPYRSTLRL